MTEFRLILPSGHTQYFDSLERLDSAFTEALKTHPSGRIYADVREPFSSSPTIDHAKRADDGTVTRRPPEEWAPQPPPQADLAEVIVRLDRIIELLDALVTKPRRSVGL